MKCEKKGNLVNRQVTVGQEDLEQINRLTRREFSQEELYCFRVVLCDNDVDRQMERFDEETLEQLARMFVGKTGICDHQPKTANQLARIYQAQVEYFPGKTNLLGEPYCAVVAKAYMVRTESNRDLILEIEAGIKKEVSVGCSIRESRCSICQSERTLQDCGHRKGEWYEGRLCHAVLHGAEDAYEWSFVAVPAQRQAGVVKESRLESQQRTVQKLWQAGEEGSGLWMDREEACQMKRMMKNLMEDCEDARRMARKELLQKAAGEQMDERASEELWEVLELLSIRQMKALGRLIDNRQTMEQPQLAVGCVAKEQAAQTAKSLNCERMVLCCQKAGMKEESLTVCAAAVAAMLAVGEAMDSYHSRPLEGIEQLEPLSEQEIETLLGDGVTVLEMADGQAECIRCVTTRTRTGNEEDRTFSSVNVVMMIDEIIRAVRERLSEMLKGKRVGFSQDSVVSQAAVVLDEKKQQGLITSFEPPVAYVQKEDPSVCVVELEFDLAAVFSRIYLTAHISI